MILSSLRAKASLLTAGVLGAIVITAQTPPPCIPPTATANKTGWKAGKVYVDLRYLSCDSAVVDPQDPMWQGAGNQCVPVANSTRHTEALQQMRSALTQWTNALSARGLEFVEVTNSTTSTNSLGVTDAFMARHNGIIVRTFSLPPDAAAETDVISYQTAGQTNTVTDRAPMKFDLNDNATFDHTKAGWANAVLKVMLHEIGHSLGLAHSTDCDQQKFSTSVMRQVCGTPNDKDGSISPVVTDCDKAAAKIDTTVPGPGPGGGGSSVDECRDPDGCQPGGGPGWVGVWNCYSFYDCDGDGVDKEVDCDDFEYDIGACSTSARCLTCGGQADGGGGSTELGAGMAVRNCQNYVEWAPVFKPGVGACLDYCAANNANACEWHLISGSCYVEFGNSCETEGGHPGWYGNLMDGGGSSGSGSMAENSAVRGCADYVEWSPVYQPDAASCLSHCQANNADACEWYGNGDCYVEFGNGCFVEGGHGGWWAAVLNQPTTSASLMAAVLTILESQSLLIGLAGAVALTALLLCGGIIVVGRRFEASGGIGVPAV